MTKFSNFDQKPQLTKATGLKEISENIELISKLIELQQSVAKEEGRTYYPENDANIQQLVNRCSDIAQETNITINIDLSCYMSQDDYQNQWNNSGCSGF